MELEFFAKNNFNDQSRKMGRAGHVASMRIKECI
jgi:hypothetical protein